MAFQRPFAAFSAIASLFHVFQILLTTGRLVHGRSWFAYLFMQLNLIHDLDQALGQQTNRGKSTLTLARQLLEDERASCLAL